MAARTNNNLKFPDLVEMLSSNAISRGEKTVFIYLLDGEAQEEEITFGELDNQVREIAAKIQSITEQQDRVLLLYPPGMDYIRGFFACLYAGVIAVPTYPPDVTRLDRTMPRFLSIVSDSKPSLILTISPIMMLAQTILGQYQELQGIQWLATDQSDLRKTDEGFNSQAWIKPAITSDTLAFLQYTSGSTAAPRGVMLTHHNLIQNLDAICHAFDVRDGDKGMFWLPFYHDMGLIGGILAPIYCGATNVLMSPLDFLQRPLRWLMAVSRHQATISGGPNFAYDLCVRKVSDEQKSDLDLSHWELAFNGAEPVRADTLDRFAAEFSECGFKREAFYPAYGLAEATLFVSGVERREFPNVIALQTEALSRGEVVPLTEAGTTKKGESWQTLVSCGKPRNDIEIAIVDPESCQLLPIKSSGTTDVGEIWVGGSSVAQGYWKREVENQRIFNAQIQNKPGRGYMRTGDLGFLHNHELYIAGRLKDLIIIDGLNHYPQDIELTVESSHPAIRPGCSAAFSVDVNDREQLVVVAEIARPKKLAVIQEMDTLDLSVDGIKNTIRTAVSSRHDLRVHDVVLLMPGSVPKTSSGKIQRHASKALYLEKALEIWTPAQDD